LGTNVLTELAAERSNIEYPVWRDILRSYCLPKDFIGKVAVSQSITVNRHAQVSIRGFTHCNIGLILSLQRLPSTGSTKKVSVIVNNVSKIPVTIPKKAILCNIPEALK
jgi:hypothetical protein